jgi:hypothetical protein
MIIVVLLIGSFFISEPLKAANYTKLWSITSDFNTGSNSSIDTSGNEAKLATTTTSFSEDFTGTTYKDGSTDADWNTSSYKLTLPGDPANGTATNLEQKWKTLYGVNDNIPATAYDSANSLVYIAGSYGQFGVFNPADSTLIDLTYKIFSDWSTSSINALSYDSTNGKIYLGGAAGKFGVFTGGSDPANGTWTYLNSKISSDWSTTDILSLAFDSTNGKIYIGGSSAKFGAFTGGSNPSNGTWVYLNAKITTDWGANSVRSLSFDSTNGYVYLGGANAKFGAFLGGSDPANGTWVYLWAKLNAVSWSIYSIAAQAFDSANAAVYLAGETGCIGAFKGGSDPANGTFYLLNGKTGSWGLNYFYGMTYDAQNSVIYVVGAGGRFGAMICNATPSNDTFSLLTTKISGDWSTNNGLTMAYAGSGKVYLGGALGKFGSYVGTGTPSNGTWANLTSNISSMFRAVSDLLATANDTTNGYVYIGGTSGKFAALKLSDSSLIDLTSKISSDWSTSGVDSMVYDSTNGKIYIGGDSGKLGVFTGGSDPANGTWVYLTSKISSDWSTNAILGMTFDSTNSKVYFGGVSAKFGCFTGGSDPANGTWVYLTAKMTSWSTTTIRAVAFDSTNGKIYIGGDSAKLSAFTGGSDPANGASVYLNSKITSDWSTSAIYALTFDSTNGKMYIGGTSGRFGVLTGGSDPANGTWVYLNSKIASDWSTNDIRVFSFGANKIIIGGGVGNFGVFVPGSDPANGTWVYLRSKITSYWLTSQAIRAVSYNPGNAVVYLTGETGEMFSFQIGYTSNKNGLSIKLNSTSQKILRATLTATDNKPANTTITYYLSSDGGVNWNQVSSAQSYQFATAGNDLRWKVNMTTTDVVVAPEITAISISYTYLTANSGTMNLTFDAGQSVVATNLSWTHTVPGTSSINFKVRSAATSGGLSSATWSDTKTAADTPVNLKTINVGGSAGIPENQWYEVQADLTSSDGISNPVIYDLSLEYVINAAPEIQTVSASQATDGSKLINISYELKDADSHQNPYHQDQVNITFQYSVNSGSAWSNCTTTSGSGLVTVNPDNSWKTFTASWNAGTDLNNYFYNNTVLIKVLANDDEQAHNTASANSGSFSLDTKNPTAGNLAPSFTGIRIGDGTSWTNDTTPDINLSATDDNALLMQLSNDGSFGGAYENYASSKTGWALSSNDGNKTVYVRYKDAFGNTTDSNSNVLLDTTPPNQPVNLKVYDTSEISLSRYSLTLIWDSVAAVADFNNYKIERKIGADDTYSDLGTSLNATYSDVGLDRANTYYYRIYATDIHNNLSTVSSEVQLQPDSTDSSAPEISGPVPSSTPSDSGAVISWLTDEASDSFVEYGTTNAFGNSQGKVEMVTTHSVSLVGLASATQYYYRVNSTDNAGNKMTGPTQSFTTKLPSEAAGSPVITGATAQKPGADPEEVTIIWTTDKYSSSQVLYGETESLGMQTAEDTTLNKTHYVTITKLSPSTKYYYQVKSKDTYGNTVLGELKYFVTTQSGGDTMPSIAGVEVSDITLDSAIISWETTVVTTSVIEYGSTESYGSRIEDISLGSTTKHVIRMKDLTQGTKYHYRVLGSTSDGSIMAANVDSTFSTLAMPVISDLSAKDISSTSATISWKTSSPADSFVDFGAEAANQSQGRSELVTDHAVTLSGLKPATHYQYVAKSRDAYSNQAVSASLSFQTIVDTTAPAIKDMKSEVSILTDESGSSKAQAIISWSTDEPATSQVKYALGVAAGSDYPLSTTEDTNLTTSHIVIISNLQPSSTYHMKLVSKDSSGNIAASDDYTVLTLNQEKSLLQYIVQILEDRFAWLRTLGLF